MVFKRYKKSFSKCLNYIKGNLLLGFFIKLVLFATGFIIISFPLENLYSEVLMKAGQYYYDKTINSDEELPRRLQLIFPAESGKSDLLIRTLLLDKYVSDTVCQAKNMTTNLRREGLMPVLFTLCLFLSFPLPARKKLFNTAMGFLLINAYVFFKLTIMAFDNYSSPAYCLYPLPAVLSQVVYYSNMFLHYTGSSTIFIVPFLVFLLLNLNEKNLRALVKID